MDKKNSYFNQNRMELVKQADKDLQIFKTSQGQFLAKLSFGSMNQLNLEKMIKTIAQIKDENIVQIYGFSVTQSQINIGKKQKNYQIFFQWHQHSLLLQIEKRRQIGKHFEQKQIIYFICIMLNIIQKYQKLNVIEYCFIHSNFIKLSNQGHIKLLNKYIGLYSKCKILNYTQPNYRPSQTNLKHMAPKDLIFQLGMLILEMCLFQKSSTLYTSSNIEIFYDRIDQRLQSIKELYSQNFVILIGKMLNYHRVNPSYFQQLMKINKWSSNLNLVLSCEIPNPEHPLSKFNSQQPALMKQGKSQQKKQPIQTWQEDDSAEQLKQDKESTFQLNPPINNQQMNLNICSFQKKSNIYERENESRVIGKKEKRKPLGVNNTQQNILGNNVYLDLKEQKKLKCFPISYLKQKQKDLRQQKKQNIECQQGQEKIVIQNLKIQTSIQPKQNKTNKETFQMKKSGIHNNSHVYLYVSKIQSIDRKRIMPFLNRKYSSAVKNEFTKQNKRLQNIHQNKFIATKNLRKQNFINHKQIQKAKEKIQMKDRSNYDFDSKRINKQPISHLSTSTYQNKGYDKRFKDQLSDQVQIFQFQNITREYQQKPNQIPNGFKYYAKNFKNQAQQSQLNKLNNLVLGSIPEVYEQATPSRFEQ